MPAHDEETLLPACLAALRRAVDTVGIPVQVLVVADTCTDQTAVTAQACGARVISIRARNVGAARAAGMTELLRLTAGRTRPRSGWPLPTPTPWCPRLAAAPAQLRRRGAGMSSSGPSKSPTGTSIRRMCRPRSRPGTEFGAGPHPCRPSLRLPPSPRLRMYTALTSASGRRPTSRRAGSGRCARPRTTPCSPPRPRRAVRSCRPATSPSRPRAAARRGRPAGSATCCGRWPRCRTHPLSRYPPGRAVPSRVSRVA